MAPVAQRTGATALALALLAACGEKSPPSPLELSCSVSLSGPEPVLTVLGRVRTSAAAGAPAITVTVDLQPAPASFALSEPGWSGSAEVRGAVVGPGQALAGRATVDGKEALGACVVSGGLPALGARADRTPTGAAISWNAVGGAATYRWRLLDGPNGTVLDAGATTGTSAQATTTATPDPAHPWLVEVGAWALSGAETSYPVPLPAPRTSFGRTLVTAGSGGGDGVTAWQLFGPGDYVGNTLTASFPVLASGERLAVLLVNAGGDDMGFATVAAVGTGSPSAPAVAGAPLQALAARTGADGDAGPDRSDVLAGEALVGAWREETIARLRDGRLRRAGEADRAGEPLGALAAAPLPPTRSFCQGQFSGTSFNHVWIRATLALETAHAAFYQADGVKPGIDAALAARPDFWTSLGAAYEDRILPALHASFGTESDLDGNGKMIFVVGNLGRSGRAFPVGFFWPGDLELPMATASSCPRNNVGNRADVLYLTDPGTFTALWSYKGTYDQVLGLVLDGEYPSTMAHELQHQINYNTRFPPGGTWGVDEELWLNEGLSMLAETVAGYGLHTPTGRTNVRNYQGTATSGQPYYQGYGMTLWEGDPYGNYAGAQAYMQYLRDHASPAMTRSLVNKWLTGKANLEAATGVAWELGFARFATAAMFSNEDLAEPNGAAGTITSSGDLLADPLLNFLGSGSPGLPAAGDYVPWHHYTDSCAGVPRARAARVAWTPLVASANAALRQDGWAAFSTGPGADGPAVLTVRSSATVRPHVVVVKYRGTLPNFAPPTCP